jgi:hypothetical protein
MRESFGIYALIKSGRVAGHRDIDIRRLFLQSQKRIPDTSSHQEEGMVIFDLFLQQADVHVEILEIVEKKHNSITIKNY